VGLKEKRKGLLDNYTERMARAEERYRQNGMMNYSSYCEEARAAMVELCYGLRDTPLVEKGMPCPEIAVICQSESCPCQTYLDYQKSRGNDEKL